MMTSSAVLGAWYRYPTLFFLFTMMTLLRRRALESRCTVVHWGCHHSSPARRRQGQGALLLDPNFEWQKCRKPQQHYHQQQQCAMSSLPSWLPETVSIWGASGWMLKTLHHDGTVPYWACFAMTNVLVRTSLVPMVLHSAHTAARFAKVAPEVQFLVTIFQRDLREQQQNGASFGQQWTLFRLTMQTMSGLYQLHNIHPLTLFLSPLMQIPIFWYASVDLRKIVNGADPALAQQLAESSVLWVPDLTEPDPWFGLPILAGILLYANVEVAVGRQSLSGETASKSNIAVYLKDFFQMIAVFMPCFMSQQPAGMQIYLCTSFLFTLVQGGALRHDGIRATLKLPKMHMAHEAELAKEFMQLKELERKAQELRGETGGPLLGTGVLAVGLEASFAGTNRPSTIIGSNPNGGPLLLADEWGGLTTTTPPPNITMSTIVKNENETYDVYQEGPFIHGISAPRKRNESLAPDHNNTTTSSSSDEEEYMPIISDQVMEAANRGEFPPTVVQMAPPVTKKVDSRLDPKRFLARRRNKGRKPR